MYVFRSSDESRKPRCKVDRVAQPPRHLLVTTIALFGLLWIGGYHVGSVLYRAFTTGPLNVALHAGLALVFCLLSYHLLRLREWARQLLLLLNGLSLFSLVVYEVAMFVVLPWVINQSTSERILTLTSLQQRIAEQMPSCGLPELIILHLYLLAAVFILPHRSTQKVFWTHQQSAAAPCSLQAKLALSLAALLFVAQLAHAVTTKLPLIRRSAAALKIHDIPLDNSPEKDPLACALFVVQQAQSADSLQRVSLLDSLAKAFSEKGEVDQVIHIAEAVVSGTQATRLTHAAVTCMKTDPLRAADLLSRAHDLARQDPSPESRERQLAAVALGYDQVGERAKTLEIIDHMASPDEKARVLCDMGAADLRAEKKDQGLKLLDRALSQALKAAEPKIRDSMLTRLALLYHEANLPKGDRLVDLIQAPSSKAEALCQRAIAERRGAPPEASERTLSQATLAAAMSANPEETLTKMVEALIGADMVEEALHVTESISGSFERAESLSRVAGWLAAHDQPERALTLLNEIATTIEAFATDPSDDTSLVTLLTQVAAHYAEAGQPSTAFEILDGLIAIVESHNPGSRRDVLIGAIARQYAQIGGMTKAYQLIESIGQAEVQMHALVHLLIQADDSDLSAQTRELFLGQIVAKYARL